MKSKISMISWKIQIALKSIVIVFDKGISNSQSLKLAWKYGLKRKLSKIGPMDRIRAIAEKKITHWLWKLNRVIINFIFFYNLLKFGGNDQIHKYYDYHLLHHLLLDTKKSANLVDHCTITRSRSGYFSTPSCLCL